MDKADKTRITGPLATPEDAAKVHGISPERQAELRQMVDKAIDVSGGEFTGWVVGGRYFPKRKVARSNGPKSR